MSARPAVLNAALAPFVAAGHRVSVVGSHLLLHDVPVVDNKCRIQLGTLVATFVYTESSITPPATHQVWLDGPFPCFANGDPIEQIRHSEVASGEVAPNVRARFYFSNKELNWAGYANHFDQLMHYWRIIADQARAIDPNCGRPIANGGIWVSPNESPFVYPDACSARGNFMSVSDRLAQSKVAIVGLGGTGSYLLDQLAKTPVREIHLFDGDVFELHNAFRSPGAAAEENFGSQKVDYYAKMYSAMRRGLIPHPDYVSDANISLLRQFDFIFVCVDKGPARKLICSALQEWKLPFIDCGMDLSMSSANEIYGTCRVTMSSEQKHDHFWNRAPTMEDSGDGLYDQNIQIADANALNALLAVMRWKQHLKFYAMPTAWNHMEYMLGAMALAKSDTIDGNNAN